MFAENIVFENVIVYIKYNHMLICFNSINSTDELILSKLISAKDYVQTWVTYY